jgi:hypothetical protein
MDADGIIGRRRLGLRRICNDFCSIWRIPSRHFTVRQRTAFKDSANTELREGDGLIVCGSVGPLEWLKGVVQS